MKAEQATFNSLETIDKIGFVLSLIAIFFILISNLSVLFFSGMLGLLLFLFLFWIIYKNRKDLWQRMTTPGFGIGFIILSVWFLIVVACISAVMSGNSYDPLAGIVRILLMPLFYYGGLAIGLVVIPMFSKKARLARPIFVLLISFGLLSRFLNYAVPTDSLQTTTDIPDSSGVVDNTSTVTSTNTDIMMTSNVMDNSTTEINNNTVDITNDGVIQSSVLDKQSDTFDNMNIVDKSGHTIMNFDANSGIAYDRNGAEVAHIENDSLVDRNGQIIASYDRSTGLFYDSDHQPLDIKQDSGAFQHVKDVHGEGVDVVNNEVFDAKTHQRIGSVDSTPNKV